MSQAKRRPHPQGCGRKLWIAPRCRHANPSQSGRCCRGQMEQPLIVSLINRRPGFAHLRPICTSWGKPCGLCGEKQVGLGLGCGRRGCFPSSGRSFATLCAVAGDVDSCHVQQIRRLSPESTQPMTVNLVNTVSNLKQAVGVRGSWGQTDRRGKAQASPRVAPGEDLRDDGGPSAVHRSNREPVLGSAGVPGRREGVSFRTFPPLCSSRIGGSDKAESAEAAHCRTHEIGKTGAGADAARDHSRRRFL
jgi:hypothetical protein